MTTITQRLWKPKSCWTCMVCVCVHVTCVRVNVCMLAGLHVHGCVCVHHVSWRLLVFAWRACAGGPECARAHVRVWHVCTCLRVSDARPSNAKHSWRKLPSDLLDALQTRTPKTINHATCAHACMQSSRFASCTHATNMDACLCVGLFGKRRVSMML